MVGGIEIQRTVFVKHALMPIVGFHAFAYIGGT